MDDPKPPYTTVASIVRNLEQKDYLNSKAQQMCGFIYMAFIL